MRRFLKESVSLLKHLLKCFGCIFHESPSLTVRGETRSQEISLLNEIIVIRIYVNIIKVIALQEPVGADALCREVNY